MKALAGGQLVQPRSNWSLITVLVPCACGMTAAGFELAAASRIVPQLMAAYNVPVIRMTEVFVLQQGGLAVGAAAGGWLSDRYGRFVTLQTSLLLAAAFALAIPFFQTFEAFLILRAFGAAAVGSVSVSVLAILSERVANAWKARTVTAMLACYILGTGLANVAAILAQQKHEWKAVFVWPGLVLLMAGISLGALKVLKESSSRQESLTQDDSMPRADFQISLGGVLLLTSMFACFINISLINAWLPVLYNRLAGVPNEEFAQVSLIGISGNLLGIVGVGLAASRLRLSHILAFTFIANIASLIALSAIRFETPLFIPTMIAYAFSQSGTQGCINILVYRAYQPHVRASAYGSLAVASRVGGIAGPLIGSLFLQFGISMATVTILLAASMVFAFVCGAWSRKLFLPSD